MLSLSRHLTPINSTHTSRAVQCLLVDWVETVVSMNAATEKPKQNFKKKKKHWEERYASRDEKDTENGWTYRCQAMLFRLRFWEFGFHYFTVVVVWRSIQCSCALLWAAACVCHVKSSFISYLLVILLSLCEATRFSLFPAPLGSEQTTITKKHIGKIIIIITIMTMMNDRSSFDWNETVRVHWLSIHSLRVCSARGHSTIVSSFLIYVTLFKQLIRMKPEFWSRCSLCSYAAMLVACARRNEWVVIRAYVRCVEWKEMKENKYYSTNCPFRKK